MSVRRWPSARVVGTLGVLAPHRLLAVRVAEWPIKPGRNVQTRWVEFEPVGGR